MMQYNTSLLESFLFITKYHLSYSNSEVIFWLDCMSCRLGVFSNLTVSIKVITCLFFYPDRNIAEYAGDNVGIPCSSQKSLKFKPFPFKFEGFQKMEQEKNKRKIEPDDVLNWILIASIIAMAVYVTLTIIMVIRQN